MAEVSDEAFDAFFDELRHAHHSLLEAYRAAIGAALDAEAARPSDEVRQGDLVSATFVGTVGGESYGRPVLTRLDLDSSGGVWGGRVPEHVTLRVLSRSEGAGGAAEGATDQPTPGSSQ